KNVVEMYAFARFGIGLFCVNLISRKERRSLKMTERRGSKIILLAVAIAISTFTLLNETVTATHNKAFPVTRSDAKADGAAIYTSRCAICHSKDGAGLPNWKSKGQPDFTNAEWQKSHTDQQITASIRDGKGKFMPSFKDKLSEEELTALVQRIRAFGKGK